MYGNQGASAVECPKQANPPSQVQSAFSSLCTELEQLSQQLVFLEDRLQPLLTPQAPTPDNKANSIGVAAPAVSSLVNDLTSAANRIGSLGSRVSRLLVQLEI